MIERKIREPMELYLQKKKMSLKRMPILLAIRVMQLKTTIMYLLQLE